MKKQFLIVTVPVANVRKKPVEASSGYTCDDLQETQVLYNEILLCRDISDGWYYIEAMEQKIITSQGDWQGYPGWIQKASVMPIDVVPAFNAVVRKTGSFVSVTPNENSEVILTLSIGTRIIVEEKEINNYYATILTDGRKGWIKKDDINIQGLLPDRVFLRKHIVETARQFLGTPYLWGGRSCGGGRHSTDKGIALNEKSREQLFLPGHRCATMNVEHRTVAVGVDCSGLTNLVYRVNMIDIPRDARDQWHAFTPVPCDDLEPGDVIFVSAEDVYDRIVHVMMYLGGEEFIEAVETGSCVAVGTFQNKYGLTLHEIVRQGCIVNKRKIYFATILTDSEGKWV